MNRTQELKLLEESIIKIMDIAKGYGLDFYPMRFEICPAEIIYTFGAYGMPARFTHWSFGKAYHRMKTQYDYNLSRIYEMVINSNPCYAFLLAGNTLVQNKMVVAHVLAHCDFFKNNAWFRHTNRDMLESMSVAAQRFREYELRFGRKRVERFLDAVMSVQQHIDSQAHIKGKSKIDCCQPQNTLYDDLWELDKDSYCQCSKRCQQDTDTSGSNKPAEDLMLFLLEQARDLQDWQRDIISTLRDEMFYFWPQMQTKIMNEGWATYWHLRIMREMDLCEAEALDFAKLHSGVVQRSHTTINPYLLGLKIFENIEKRWGAPSPQEIEKYYYMGSEGREKIFEVRSMDNDVSFLRNYLTKELVEELDMYLYRKIGQDYKVVDKNWEEVRDGLVKNLTNSGVPFLVVEDGDYKKRGELFLRHCYEGMELDVPHLEKTLPQIFHIWGRPVHLETVIDNKPILFSFDGLKLTKKLS